MTLIPKYRILYLVIAMAILGGCENVIGFHSKSKLDQNIGGTWEVLVRPVSDPIKAPIEEDWIMGGGVFYVVKNTGSVVDTFYTGGYAIDASLSKSFLVLVNVDPLNTELEARWEILELNTKVCRIARTYGGGGVATYEFQKK